MTDLPDAVKKYYVALKKLEDGRFCGVHRLLYHWTLHIGIDEIGYEDRYCYPELDQALIGLAGYTGEGDPPGSWNRHPVSGRRRNIQTGEEWIDP